MLSIKKHVEDYKYFLTLRPKPSTETYNYETAFHNGHIPFIHIKIMLPKTASNGH